MSNNSTEIPYVDPEALAPYWRENTPIWEGDPTKTYTWWCINAHTFRTTAVNAYKRWTAHVPGLHRRPPRPARAVRLHGLQHGSVVTHGRLRR